MLQIKTIAKDFQKDKEFDEQVNAAIAEGWELVKRELVDSPKYGDLILYAELEKYEEPEQEPAPIAYWGTTRDPHHPFRCSICGHLTHDPALTCPKCGAVMSDEEGKV